jgi:hypothetical protein
VPPAGDTTGAICYPGYYKDNLISTSEGEIAGIATKKINMCGKIGRKLFSHAGLFPFY